MNKNLIKWLFQKNSLVMVHGKRNTEFEKNLLAEVKKMDKKALIFDLERRIQAKELSGNMYLLRPENIKMQLISFLEVPELITKRFGLIYISGILNYLRDYKNNSFFEKNRNMKIFAFILSLLKQYSLKTNVLVKNYNEDFKKDSSIYGFVSEYYIDEIYSYSSVNNDLVLSNDEREFRITLSKDE